MPTLAPMKPAVRTATIKGTEDQIAIKAADIIEKAGHGIRFRAIFTKKDGTIREIYAQMHVNRGVKGSGRVYNPEVRHLLPCFDLKKEYEELAKGRGPFNAAANSHRVINLRTLIELEIEGDTLYVFVIQKTKKKAKVYA